MHAYPSLYEELNSQKRCIELDLKSDDGVRQALALAVDVDVVVEGYRPGVAARLGIGYDAIRAVNPARRLLLDLRSRPGRPARARVGPRPQLSGLGRRARARRRRRR